MVRETCWQQNETPSPKGRRFGCGLVPEFFLGQIPVVGVCSNGGELIAEVF